MAKRGEVEVIEESSFHSKNRAKQLIDFKGMKFRYNVRPTDIDCFNGEALSASLDFRDGKKGFVFYEVKYEDNPMDEGQVRHLEALCNNLRTPSMALHVSHSVHNTDDSVYLKYCVVKDAYYCDGKSTGKWFGGFNGLTAYDATKQFIEKHCPEYIVFGE